MSEVALRALAGDLLEYFDWERAMDEEPEFAVFHEGTFPTDATRRLGSLLLSVPEHALQVVARTVAWCVMEPGLSEGERAPMRAELSAAMRGHEVPGSSAGGGVVRVARAGFRFLLAQDTESFVTMMALFDELRCRSYSSPPARAGDNARWLTLVLRPSHGDVSPVLPALLELVDSVPAGPRRVRVALFDSAEFAQVWSADASFEPVDCLIRVPEPVLTRRIMHVSPEVVAPLASPLAVEYLVERALLFSVLEDTYSDMARRIDYEVGDRRWSHTLE